MEGPVHGLVEADIPSRKRDASGSLETDRLYAAWAVVLVGLFAEQCSLAKAIAYMRPPFQVDPEVADPPPVLQSIPDVHEVDPDAKANGICRI